jgi:hypothetical protein
VYDVLAREREGSDLTLAHCWAHVRRKFVEAEPHYPEASEMLDRIGQLYATEAEAKRASPEERLATLAALRAKQSKPVLDEIRTWLMTPAGTTALLSGESHRHAVKVAAHVWGYHPARWCASPRTPRNE